MHFWRIKQEIPSGNHKRRTQARKLYPSLATLQQKQKKKQQKCTRDCHTKQTDATQQIIKNSPEFETSVILFRLSNCTTYYTTESLLDEIPNVRLPCF